MPINQMHWLTCDGEHPLKERKRGLPEITRPIFGNYVHKTQMLAEAKKQGWTFPDGRKVDAKTFCPACSK